MTESLKLKTPNQALEVLFYQNRTPGDWSARIYADGQTFRIGPASMKALFVNVCNFLALEMKYADVRVHGENNDNTK